MNRTYPPVLLSMRALARELKCSASAVRYHVRRRHIRPDGYDANGNALFLAENLAHFRRLLKERCSDIGGR